MKQETIELKPAKGFTFKPYELNGTIIEFNVEYRNKSIAYSITLSDIINKINKGDQ